MNNFKQVAIDLSARLQPDFRATEYPLPSAANRQLFVSNSLFDLLTSRLSKRHPNITTTDIASTIRIMVGGPSVAAGRQDIKPFDSLVGGFFKCSDVGVFDSNGARFLDESGTASFDSEFLKFDASAVVQSDNVKVRCDSTAKLIADEVTIPGRFRTETPANLHMIKIILYFMVPVPEDGLYSIGAFVPIWEGPKQFGQPSDYTWDADLNKGSFQIEIGADMTVSVYQLTDLGEVHVQEEHIARGSPPIVPSFTESRPHPSGGKFNGSGKQVASGAGGGLVRLGRSTDATFDHAIVAVGCFYRQKITARYTLNELNLDGHARANLSYGTLLENPVVSVIKVGE